MRDYGRDAVYRAERRVFARTQTIFPDQGIRLAKRAMRWARDNLDVERPMAEVRIVDRLSRGCDGRFLARPNVIQLTATGAFFPWLVLHEVAHWATWPPLDRPHGGMWQAVYVDLVRVFMGEELAWELEEAFVNARRRPPRKFQIQIRREGDWRPATKEEAKIARQEAGRLLRDGEEVWVFALDAMVRKVEVPR